MNSNSIKSHEPIISSWNLDSLTKKISRTKKHQIETELKEETTIYNLGSILGNGARGAVYNLLPDNPEKKIKAIKLRHERKQRLDLEFIILMLLPKSAGLSLPPKGYIGGSIVLAKYDFTLESILTKMTPKMKKEAIEQLVNGLCVLHEAGFCHCDIRSKNIMCRTKNGETRYDLIDFSEAWPFKNPKLHYDETIYNEKKFLEDKQKDIIFLGLQLYDIVCGNRDKPLTHEIMQELDLPTSFADVINYMISRKNYPKDMKVALQIIKDQ